ncbi:MAG: 3-oxoacyl-(acyl-carrier-protein) reductase FabG [candidate division WS6 bacterium OLB20]|uniref:3-oxoacyl-(Acyl-carrier-protein) reductase FabG n=1 Tax=candidate division WS6 bacterium OLB20 TaxID=1617426 RepID=A0A136LYH0_9BACT|nr:MAG: 3-oxoacyl-(acyl-carrier-protein) reductase FabG [candidate division WS6 bacterium OLB20]
MIIAYKFPPMSQTALVTGASKGIGKAIALRLAHDGFNIIVHYNRSQKEAQNVSEEIRKTGRESWIVQADLADDTSVREMFNTIADDHDSLDLLVNNAGMDHAKMIEDYTLEEMREVIDVVLFGKISCTKLALPLLKKSQNPGIINIASRMGKEKTIPTIGAYGPAEAGVIKWTQCCALEFAQHRIRVNCVAPGLTRTSLTEDIFLDESDGDTDKAESIWNEMAARNPSHRVGKPDDVAGVVSFLASDDASYINGETIGVNGGSNLG